MQTNNHKTRDYGAVLDAEFGTPGTDKFAASVEEARNFYTVPDKSSPPVIAIIAITASGTRCK